MSMTTLGYMRISTADQDLALQRDALIASGVDPDHIYSDQASGKRDDRPGLEHCLKALRKGDVLVVWKLDRLGRSMIHLIKTVYDLEKRGVGFKVLTGDMDTTTAAGKMVLGILASFAEFERNLISDRTREGLKAARKRGRCGGRPPALTKAEVCLAQVRMRDPNASVSSLCKELGVGHSTLYKYVEPGGELRELGRKVMGL